MKKSKKLEGTTTTFVSYEEYAPIDFPLSAKMDMSLDKVTIKSLPPHERRAIQWKNWDDQPEENDENMDRERPDRQDQGK